MKCESYSKKVAEHFGHAVIEYVEFQSVKKKTLFFTFIPLALQPNADDGLIIILEFSTSHDAPHSVGLL